MRERERPHGYTHHTTHASPSYIHTLITHKHTHTHTAEHTYHRPFSLGYGTHTQPIHPANTHAHSSPNIHPTGTHPAAQTTHQKHSTHNTHNTQQHIHTRPNYPAAPPPSLSVRSLIMADSAFKKIQIQRDDTTFDAYVVGKEDAPGIVVLQEWWGVDFEIKNHALKVSQFDSGYKALIPDLYRGKVGLDVAEAQHLMDGLDWQGAVKDIRASVNWLKANGSQKVGVTGFCMGGALTIASSVLVPEVDAVVAFYGVPSSELADPAHAKAPVQAHFGELDSFVGFSDVTAAKALEEKLKASGVPYEVHVYPSNAHAFMNRSPEGVERRKGMGLADDDEAAVELAWSRFRSWMSRFLSP